VTARRNAYIAGFTLLAAMGHAEARDLGLEEFGRLRSGRQLRPRARQSLGLVERSRSHHAIDPHR
jgi:hypothetical protein